MISEPIEFCLSWSTLLKPLLLYLKFNDVCIFHMDQQFQMLGLLVIIEGSMFLVKIIKGILNISYFLQGIPVIIVQIEKNNICL